jgi:UDP-2-acetamido-3-amino-2,3-dideoxy-glucuronate N-acetyltransferase
MAKSLIAIVGVGYWGKGLLRVFDQLGALKVFCDKDEDILAKRKKEYPGVMATTNFNEILRDRDIKGVVIATPAPTHYKLARKAIITGKDVLIEKPLALNLAEGEKLVKLAKKRKNILMVDHLFLYHPALLKIKEIVKKGRLGKIYHIHSTRLNFGIIRTEENALWSLSPHDISLIIEIIGNLPDEVNATSEAYLDNKILDTVRANLKFKKNKISANFFVSWLNPFKERKLIIVGSKAMLIFDDLSRDKIMIHDYRIKWIKNKRNHIFKTEAIKSVGKIVKITKKEPLIEVARDFLNSINTRQQPKANGEEACDVLRILEACQESIRNNGKSVKI